MKLYSINLKEFVYLPGKEKKERGRDITYKFTIDEDGSEKRGGLYDFTISVTYRYFYHFV